MWLQIGPQLKCMVIVNGFNCTAFLQINVVKRHRILTRLKNIFELCFNFSLSISSIWTLHFEAFKPTLNTNPKT